ncbi:hypothetical protein MMC15_001131 [Xylographa vitiligo]|nr:hypothetical protein [Xylographa vitiligo]
MASSPNGSTPELSWLPHTWATMQGAATEDGGQTLSPQLSSIANHYHQKGDFVGLEKTLTKHTTTLTHHPFSANHDVAHSDGSDAHQRPEDNFAHCGIVLENKVTTNFALWNEYRPFDFLLSTAADGQSPDSYSITRPGTHVIGTLVSYDHHIGDTAPPTVFAAMSGSANVTETTPLTPTQHSVKNSPRFPCLHKGCVRTFGRIADLDRHYKKHVPNAAKFYCYEIGCKFNGKPFYRRDKLLSHQRNMHATCK